MTKEACSGAMVLVVGPSGAGKDTLMREAALRLRKNPNYVFPRRLVTREAQADVEDHVSISRTKFEALVAAGQFCLSWEAHGLGYIIPQEVLRSLDQGKIAVCNVSRSVLGDAQRRFPNCATIFINVDRTERARRLAKRGRESVEQVAQRLAHEPPKIPTNVDPIIVDNSGSLDDGVARFVKALEDCACP